VDARTARHQATWWVGRRVRLIFVGYDLGWRSTQMLGEQSGEMSRSYTLACAEHFDGRTFSVESALIGDQTRRPRYLPLVRSAQAQGLRGLPRGDPPSRMNERGRSCRQASVLVISVRGQPGS
jgi:hypothetical protein